MTVRDGLTWRRERWWIVREWVSELVLCSCAYVERTSVFGRCVYVCIVAV